MTLGALGFLSPLLLAGLLALPLIWWLLRATPPEPRRFYFPAIRLLKGLQSGQTTPDRSPWWLTLLRMIAAALVIFALAEPVLNPDRATLAGSGPVVLVVDNSWAAADSWERRVETLSTLIGNADRAGRQVLLVPTAETIPAVTISLRTAAAARDLVGSLSPRPYAPARLRLIEAIGKALANERSTSAVWLTDGLQHGSDATFAGQLAGLVGGAGNLTVVSPNGGLEALAIRSRLGDGGRLFADVLRSGGPARDGVLEALSAKGQVLASSRFSLAAGATSSEVGFDLPVEIRNQVTRVAVVGVRSAGAVSLIDSSSRWNRIGLVSGVQQEQAQPLLSPLHYLERALRPFSELIEAEQGASGPDIAKLIDRNATVLVLADIGKLTETTAERIAKYVSGGGILVRFAGPRLEQGGDALLPADLRTGGRSLGGALTWSTPQLMAVFEQTSPFAGLTVPADVTVSRQVLADPALLTERTQIWARLVDGTPLVTAERRDGGWIILFHVTANGDWSNLPLSGLFVDMLKRIAGLTGLAGRGQSESVEASAVADDPNLLAPVETLNGFGELGSPPPETQPIARADSARLVPGARHPPGLYGPPGSVSALNVVDAKTELKPIAGLPAGAVAAGYRTAEPFALKPWCFVLALMLLLADIVAVTLLQLGGLSRLFRRSQVAAISVAVVAGALLVAFAALAPISSRAQDAPADQPSAALPVDDAFALEVSGRTRLAYILTGDAAIDETSRRGLVGLGQMLELRTAVEPAAPVGVDVDRHELVFFPIIYWPVLADTKELSEATASKVSAYMKSGGMIVFDTRDEGDRVPALDGSVGGSPALQRLLSGLDIPRLEQVPAEHVLTKSFYLLSSFPGRWDGGPLWAEAGSTDDPAAADRSRHADGVSAILVTSNDLASAWAIDESGSAIFPCVPGGEEQREFAYRTGVNIVMYALTGNYKADQVHVPALLERLGQ